MMLFKCGKMVFKGIIKIYEVGTVVLNSGTTAFQVVLPLNSIDRCHSRVERLETRPFKVETTLNDAVKMWHDIN